MGYKNRDKQRAFQRRWYAERRAYYFIGKTCARCTETDGLELHHVDSEQKVSHRIWSWSQVRRDEELAKCIVLCAKHHQEETSKLLKKPLKHGTSTAYRKGCRCPECRTARAERSREYRARVNTWIHQ